MSALTKRRATVAGICLVAVLGAGAGTWAVLDAQAADARTASTQQQRRTGDTATVTKGDLTDSKTYAGSLGFGDPVSVPGAASGTLTWLPEPGQVVHRDEPLYAVDEHPVRAMYGTTPLWRDLVRGTKGTDVHQLNENLAALGYDVSVDDVFGKRTAAAVARYQRDRGLPVTRTLTKQDIAFVDGEVRVASVGGTLGQPAGGDVLRVTPTKRVVRAAVSEREAERLAVGTKVRVRVNGTGDPLPGSVVDSRPETGDDGKTSIAVTIDFDAGDRTLPSAASAQVLADGQTERGVLSVPIAALVAGKGDGAFAVDVVRSGGRTERVPVRAGLVADGRVAVTGDVREGDRVVVPS